MKDIIAKIIAYRFWIIVPAAALLPLVGWAMSVTPLQNKTRQEQTAADSAFRNVDTFLKAPKRPNKEWIETAQAKRAIVKQAVDSTWLALYERQKPLMTWPEDVRKEMTGIEFGQPIPAQVLQQYRQSYGLQWDELYRLADPYDPNDPELSKGKLIFDPRTTIKFEDWSLGSPPFPAAWRAQEDVWIQRAILTVIRDTNSRALNHLSAPVQQIYNMGIAENVGQRPESDPPPARGVQKAPAAAQPPGAKPAQDPMAALSQVPENRYVKVTPQYKVVPIYLQLLVEQQSIPELLVKFANSKIPIETKQVSMSVPTTQAAGQPANPAARPKVESTDYFVVELRAHAYLYKEPQLAGKPAPPAPSASAPAPGAPPAAPAAAAPATGAPPAK